MCAVELGVAVWYAWLGYATAIPIATLRTTIAAGPSCRAGHEGRRHSDQAPGRLYLERMIATQSPEGWAAIAAWITAGLIFGGLLFARSQVNEARRLGEARVRPFVVVDFEAEPT